MDSHIKKIHQNDNKKYVCETCNNSFSSAPNLKQHIKTVHEVEVMIEMWPISLLTDRFIIFVEGIRVPDLQKAI